MNTLSLILAIVGATAGAAGIVWGYMHARADQQKTKLAAAADQRDDVRAIMEIKDEIISSLRESNDELRAANVAAIAREEKWLEERAEYKTRLSAIEDAYRQIVEAVSAAGICARASSCENYQPPANGTLPRNLT